MQIHRHMSRNKGLGIHHSILMLALLRVQTQRLLPLDLPRRLNRVSPTPMTLKGLAKTRTQRSKRSIIRNGKNLCFRESVQII